MIISEYDSKCSKKLIKPTFLKVRYYQYSAVLKWSKPDLLRLRNIVFNYARDCFIEHNFRVKRAPTFPLHKIFDLIKSLWLQKLPNNKGSLLKRRRASTMLMWCLATGSRWADALVLKWEDMSILQANNRYFILFDIRISKTDPFAENDDIRSIAAVRNKYWECPVSALLRYWHYRGRPLSGFVFSHHLSGAKPTNARSSFYFVTATAKLLKWPNLPTKHTPRVTMVKVMAMFGFSIEQINHHFGWNQSSQMFWHYLGGNLVTKNTSPAASLAQALEKRDGLILNDVPKIIY